MTKFRVGSKYKPLVMSTRYKKSPYTARTILHPKTTLRNATLAQVNRLVKREVHLICSRKHGDSVLRLSDMNAVKSFHGELFCVNFDWTLLHYIPSCELFFSSTSTGSIIGVSG